jgi:hypothetical protein
LFGLVIGKNVVFFNERGKIFFFSQNAIHFLALFNKEGGIFKFYLKMTGDLFAKKILSTAKNDSKSSDFFSRKNHLPIVKVG